MKKLLVVVLAVCSLFLIAAGVALGTGAEQQRPVTMRTVLTKTINPTSAGDVVASKEAGGVINTYHYARVPTNLMTLADPPLAQVYFTLSSSAEGQQAFPPNWLTTSTGHTPTNRVILREGEILILYKVVFSDTSGNPLSTWVEMRTAADGLIHLTAVVVK